MAEIAIAVALAVVEGVIVHLANKKIDETVVPVDLEEAKIWLGKTQEILSESEKNIDEGGPNLPCYYVNQVQDLAYAIENALDEFMLQLENSSLHKIIPRKLMKNNAHSKLSSKLNDITKKKSNAQILQEPHVQPTPASSSGGDRIYCNQDLAEGDELVGFEAREEQLFTELKQADQSRVVILIAGPGGSGKSTLANKVCRSHEDGGALAWVELPKISKEEAKTRCLPRSGVQGQDKFLVVLDDAWIKEDLQYIVKKLPNGRIIITSRNSGVASLLYPDYICIHDLSRGLSGEKAKELFCKKAFHDGRGDWPPELADCAKKILKRCEGMPLAISAIGTFLFNKKIPADWKMLHDSLRSELCKEGSDLLIIGRNLQASYRDLPNRLRSCFLYFSIFPDKEEEEEGEYYSISRERLIRLWAAEKFVQAEKGKTIEQAAEGYLNELVERNLVVATERESEGGRVRRCRVLNLVREINISRRKGFITVWEPDDHLPTEKIRRLSAHNGGIKKIKSMIRSVRTLLAFGQAISDLEVVLNTAKYLKVLDLEGTTGLKEFPEAVKRLILLNYLSLRKTDVQRVPKSIKKNVFLETLDLKSTKVTELPEEIKELKKLRHLLVNSYNDASHRFEGVEISKGVEDLSNSILKLSLIKVKNTEFIKALSKLKHLRKLGLVDLETKDGKELCDALGKMEFLSTLDLRAKDGQSLSLDHHMQFPPLCLRHLYLRGSLQELPKWICKLTSLQKVGLHGSNLNANPLEVIQALPNLIELNLVGYYGGEELVFRADQFKKLRTLIIEQFAELKSLQDEDGALPVLMELTISRCPNLQSLPKAIGGLIELNLVGCYRGEELVFRADQFKKLRTLIIEQFDQLTSFQVEDGPLPVLRELNISHRPNLKSLPKAIGGLIELNLVGCYRGEELVIRADQFKKLRTLIIEQFDQLTSFQVEDGALPVLRELNISHCPNLKSLPKGIGGFKSLYKLFLQHMPDELIAMLQKGSPHRHMVRHILVLHSYKDGTGLHDLSENVSNI